LLGIYEKTLDCIMSTPDVIGSTKEIMHEYESRAYPSVLTLQAFIQDLKNKGKWKFFNKSYIDSNFRRHGNVRPVHYPIHSRDRKWITVAIAIRARYIISTNGHLLKVSPSRINGDTIETVYPDRYVAERCPSRNAD
jgi:predicted nucleic acid-binding protein